jgi:signal transduction histidine kinase
MQIRSSAVAWLLCSVAAALVGIALGSASFGGPPVTLGDISSALALTITFPVVGALIAAHRPENPLGWLFLAIGLFFGVATAATSWASAAFDDTPGDVPFGAVVAWISVWTWPPGFVLMFTFVLLLFPDGRLPSRRWRPVVWLSAVALVLVTAPVAVTAWAIRGPLLTQIEDDPPAGVSAAFRLAFEIQVLGIVLTFLLGLASAASLIVRFRRATGDERQQIKWFAFAGTLVVVLLIGTSPLFNLPEALTPIALPLIPAASAIAIFKYRLYEIDVVIRKTLVFGVLAAFITLVYMALVVGPVVLLGGAGSSSSVVLSAVAAAFVAVAFQPVRERANRLANRLVYGKRATPYEVLTRFSERMGETFATEDVLPRMARILGEGTGAVRADVWLKTGTQLVRAASWPAAAQEPVSIAMGAGDLSSLEGHDAVVAVRHQGELLGALTLNKPVNEPLTAAEITLVEHLADQAGLVLRNVALIADLRASRQRLVAAQDDERRRLERNLHDGAQQHLVALAVKQRLAQGMLDRDIDTARRLLDEIQTDTADALENLRDLARGIYPPLLADRGLGVALEAQARKASVPVTVEADDVGRYPADIEAAVYFSCLEALQNVAKYASASRAIVRLADELGDVTFAVRDDGRGFDPQATGYGTGLQGIADRLAAFDGVLDVRSAPGQGSAVCGRIPAAAVRLRADANASDHRP